MLSRGAYVLLFVYNCLSSCLLNNITNIIMSRSVAALLLNYNAVGGAGDGSTGQGERAGEGEKEEEDG